MPTTPPSSLPVFFFFFSFFLFYFCSIKFGGSVCVCEKEEHFSPVSWTKRFGAVFHNRQTSTSTHTHDHQYLQLIEWAEKKKRKKNVGSTLSPYLSLACGLFISLSLFQREKEREAHENNQWNEDDDDGKVNLASWERGEGGGNRRGLRG